MNFKKNIFILLSVIFLVLSLSRSAAAQESTKPISEKGLEDALKIGGLKPQELVGIIDKRGVDFLLTPDVEQQLRGDGATPEVIDAVRSHYRNAALEGDRNTAPAGDSNVEPPHSSYSSGGSLPSAAGVYYKDGSSWVQLHPESVNWKHQGLMHNLTKDSGGLLHGEMTGEVAGTHSPATMHSPASFLIHTKQGAMLGDYLLVHLHEKHDNREFKVALGGTSSADSVEFRTAKINDNTYEIDFTQGAGEYAFFTRSIVPTGNQSPQSGEVLTFRILE